MRRRKYLALTSAGLTSLLAGCSFGNDDETPTETPTDTQTPTDTPENGTETDETTPPSGIQQPQSMTDIAAFTYNHHIKRLEDLPYTMTIESHRETSDGVREQKYTFRFNGTNRSVFFLEVNNPDQSGTIEKYSTGGLVYTRNNLEGSEISYQQDILDEGTVLKITGQNQIDQLDQSGVEVGEPEEQETFVYRYPITAHNAYDSVDGYIELDVQQGLITAIDFEGQSSDSSYTLSIEFNYGGITVEPPAWIRDMDDSNT